MKFNLNRFNPEFFDRLRSRVIKARDKGFYVSIMFFQGWSIDTSFGKQSNPWKSHPFNKNNNVNGIDSDFYNHNGEGEEYHSILDSRILNYQKAYVRKVIDTVNDLDNVIYEIANEDPSRDSYWTQKHKEWQYELVDYVKSYETTKSKQHPVGITSHRGLGNNFVFNSKADWVSPAHTGKNTCSNDSYKDNPPIFGAKVILLDTDHLWGIGGRREWVWKSFMRGYNPIYMDPLNDTFTNTCGGICTTIDMVDVRKNMGYTLDYANRINLASTFPRNDLASITYCLANPGSEYLIYQPNSGSFIANLVAGDYVYEWFMPNKGRVQETGAITAGGGKMSFTPPFKGDALLYLYLHEK